MVVRGNRDGLDACADQEVDQHRFHLGLTGLEIITSDKGFPLFSQLHQAGHERVLRRTVDEGDALVKVLEVFIREGSCVVREL